MMWTPVVNPLWRFDRCSSHSFVGQMISTWSPTLPQRKPQLKAHTSVAIPDSRMQPVKTNNTTRNLWIHSSCWSNSTCIYVLLIGGKHLIRVLSIQASTFLLHSLKSNLAGRVLTLKGHPIKNRWGRKKTSPRSNNLKNIPIKDHQINPYYLVRGSSAPYLFAGTAELSSSLKRKELFCGCDQMHANHRSCERIQHICSISNKLAKLICQSRCVCSIFLWVINHSACASLRSIALLVALVPLPAVKLTHLLYTDFSHGQKFARPLFRGKTLDAHSIVSTAPFRVVLRPTLMAMKTWRKSSSFHLGQIFSHSQSCGACTFVSPVFLEAWRCSKWQNVHRVRGTFS